MGAKSRLLVGASLASALLGASAGKADDAPLVGTSGPGFSISLKNADGTAVKHLDPAARTITVHDLSTAHSFHLIGPGVDMATDVESLSEASWNVTLTDGAYKFFCDAHPTLLHGTFTVGNVDPPQTNPPGVRKLTAAVGPGAKISLRRGSAVAKTTVAGSYAITVHDRSAKDNFHLLGPGVSDKTGIAFKGTVTWKVKLKKGKTYRYRSDAHPRLGGSVRAT